MVEEENRIEKRYDKIINWFKNPYNLILVGILLLAFILRLYFFIQTQGQPLWYDEAEYMAHAKEIAFNVPYTENPQRPPLFQYLAALIFVIGLGEGIIKFLWVMLPSLALVFGVYLLGKEMYNKNVGLVAAFLTTVMWSYLFWTARVQPDFFSMFFSVLSVWCMWIYWKRQDGEGKIRKFAIWAGVLSALAFYFKVSALLIPVCFIIFALIKDRIHAFKVKDYWYSALAFVLTLVPYFIWSQLSFSTPLAFRAGYSNAFIQPTPFAWNVINYFYLMTENIIFVLFIIGLIFGLRFILYSDVLIKDKKKCFDPNIFSIILLIVVAAFYIFYIRGVDDRWVFLWMPFIFYLCGSFIDFGYTYLKKYKKSIAIIVVIIILAVAGVMQVNHANKIIQDKKETYLPVKESGIWIKENSNPGDLILSPSYTQSVYYTERNVSLYDSGVKTLEEADIYINNSKAKYMQVSVFEPMPPWVNEWVQKNQNRLIARQAYFADPERKQAVLIVYEIIY